MQCSFFTDMWRCPFLVFLISLSVAWCKRIVQSETLYSESLDVQANGAEMNHTMRESEGVNAESNGQESKDKDHSGLLEELYRDGEVYHVPEAPTGLEFTSTLEMGVPLQQHMPHDMGYSVLHQAALGTMRIAEVARAVDDGSLSQAFLQHTEKTMMDKTLYLFRYKLKKWVKLTLETANLTFAVHDIELGIKAMGLLGADKLVTDEDATNQFLAMERQLKPQEPGPEDLVMSFDNNPLKLNLHFDTDAPAGIYKTIMITHQIQTDKKNIEPEQAKRILASMEWFQEYVKQRAPSEEAEKKLATSLYMDPDFVKSVVQDLGDSVGFGWGTWVWLVSFKSLLTAGQWAEQIRHKEGRELSAEAQLDSSILERLPVLKSLAQHLQTNSDEDAEYANSWKGRAKITEITNNLFYLLGALLDNQKFARWAQSVIKDVIVWLKGLSVSNDVTFLDSDRKPLPQLVNLRETPVPGPDELLEEVDDEAPHDELKGKTKEELEAAFSGLLERTFDDASVEHEAAFSTLSRYAAAGRPNPAAGCLACCELCMVCVGCLTGNPVQTHRPFGGYR